MRHKKSLSRKPTTVAKERLRKIAARVNEARFGIDREIRRAFEQARKARDGR